MVSFPMILTLSDLAFVVYESCWRTCTTAIHNLPVTFA